MLYLAADVLSLLGNAVAFIALPWLVLVRTGDVALAGTIAAVSAIPAILSAVVGGVLVDRVGRRRMTIVADLGSAAAVAALPVVDAVTGLTATWFVLLGVLGALVDVPGLTARESLLPEVARRSGLSIERLSGLREGIAGVTLIVGPAVGGLLVATLGAVTALWVTAATSALAAAVTALLPQTLGRAAEPAPGPTELTAPRRWLADLREGVAVLRSDRALSVLTALMTASLFVLGPLQGLLLPAHLVQTGSASTFGVVVTTLAAGGLVGAVLYAALAPRLTRRQWFTAALLVSCAGLVGLAALPDLPLLLVAAGAAGLGSGPLGPLLMVVVAERVPDAVRGRVLGLQNAAALAAMPAGLLLVGLLVEAVDVDAAGRVLAAGWILVTIAALVVTGRGVLDHTPEDTTREVDASARGSVTSPAWPAPPPERCGTTTPKACCPRRPGTTPATAGMAPRRSSGWSGSAGCASSACPWTASPNSSTANPLPCRPRWRPWTPSSPPARSSSPLSAPGSLPCKPLPPIRSFPRAWPRSSVSSPSGDTSPATWRRRRRCCCWVSPSHPRSPTRCSASICACSRTSPAGPPPPT